MILRNDLKQLDKGNLIPAKGAARVEARVMRGRISPRLLTTFVVGMPQQTCCWIVQVLVVDKHLLGRFGVCVSAVAEHPTVANQKGKRHQHPISPTLPVAADRLSVPETTGAG